MEIQPTPMRPLVVRTGRWVYLRHTTPSDYEFIYVIETTGERTARYRLRGQATGFDNYVRNMWNTVLNLFIVCAHSGQPLGAAVAYNADFRDQHAYIAAVAAPEHGLGSKFLEGVELLLDFIFEQYPFRKLYGEGLEGNLEHSSVTAGFREEGRLREHAYVDGHYEDFLFLAMHREDWARRKNEAPRTFSDRVRRAEQKVSAPGIEDSDPGDADIEGAAR